ncbi:hypothetical protein D3C80_721310 [compost metagenome]
MSAVEVVGPQRGRQTVDAVVGQLQGVGFIVECRNRQHRAEYFIAKQRHVRRHAGKNRRLDEVVRAVEDRLSTATDPGRALLFGLLDELHDARGLTAVDDGPGGARRVQRIARQPAFGLGFEAFDKLVMDRALHQQPRVGRADFALIEEDTERGFLGRQVQILTIGKHQVGALAAALQPHLLEVRLRRVLHEIFADLGGAGEHQAIDVRVQAEGLAGLLAEPRQHVQHTRRYTGFQRQLSQAQGGKRRLFGRLEDHRVTGGQGWGEFPRRHVQREIPRHHRSHHAQGFASNGCQHVLRTRRDLIVEFVEAFGVPAEHSRGTRHVDVVGIRDGLAHVQRVEQRQFFTVFEDQVGQAQQHLLAFGR